MTQIRFYRASDKWGELSNCYPRPILFEGRTYAASEIAYQRAAPKIPVVQEWLAKCPCARICATFVHNGLLRYDFSDGWLPNGDDVDVGPRSRKRNPSEAQLRRMRAVAYAKFDQHDDLRNLLLRTGDAVLVEDTRGRSAIDMIWGCGEHCPEGEDWDPGNLMHGGNWLGRILMDTRDALGASAT